MQTTVRRAIIYKDILGLHIIDMGEKIEPKKKTNFINKLFKSIKK